MKKFSTTLLVVLCALMMQAQTNYLPTGQPVMYAQIKAQETPGVDYKMVFQQVREKLKSVDKLGDILRIAEYVALQKNGTYHMAAAMQGPGAIQIVFEVPVDSIKPEFWNIYNEITTDSSLVVAAEKGKSLIILMADKKTDKNAALKSLLEQKTAPAEWNAQYWGDLIKMTGDHIQADLNTINYKGDVQAICRMDIEITKNNDVIITGRTMDKPAEMDNIVQNIAKIGEAICQQHGLDKLSKDVLVLPSQKKPNYGYINVQQIFKMLDLGKMLREKSGMLDAADYGLSDLKMNMVSEIFYNYNKKTHTLVLSTKGQFEF